MSGETYRVRIVPHDEDIPLGANVWGFVVDDATSLTSWLVLDETPGVYLEGVTAEDVRIYESEEPIVRGSADEAAFDRVADALRKASA